MKLPVIESGQGKPNHAYNAEEELGGDSLTLGNIDEESKMF